MQKLGLICKFSNPLPQFSSYFPSNNARVVVCFCEGRTVRGLLAAIRANKLEGLFHIMGRYGSARLSTFSRLFVYILAMAGLTGLTSYRAWRQPQWVKDNVRLKETPLFWFKLSFPFYINNLKFSSWHKVLQKRTHAFDKRLFYALFSRPHSWFL